MRCLTQSGVVVMLEVGYSSERKETRESPAVERG